MNDAAVRVRGLGKEFHIGKLKQPYKTLREAIAGAVSLPLRLTRRRRSEDQDEGPSMIWALKDVTFDVAPGEVVGVIGRNGAGKSTLLKILSRITEPTEGFAEIRGRVGSLLEVGTGFHSELTGRENVYLNGAILGMKREEIRGKFDEIVSFAEVERFIDTPVKHYSSGMYLRLAFAVAAHLEPDILIVDEVLAVGDARFQTKCLNKMQNVGQQGRTVLFVSHNMPAITRLCERAILFEGGRLTQDGRAPEVVRDYLSAGLSTTAAQEWPDLPGGEVAGLFAVRVRSEDGRISDTVDIRRPVRVEIEWEVWKTGYEVMPSISLANEEGVIVFTSNEADPAWRERPRPLGRFTSTVRIPGNFLAEGAVFVSADLSTLNPYQKQVRRRDAVAFHVVDSLEGDASRVSRRPARGVVRPLLEWRTQFMPGEPAKGTGADLDAAHVPASDARRKSEADRKVSGAFRSPAPGNDRGGSAS